MGIDIGHRRLTRIGPFVNVADLKNLLKTRALKLISLQLLGPKQTCLVYNVYSYINYLEIVCRSHLGQRPLMHSSLFETSFHSGVCASQDHTTFFLGLPRL